jgi:hypothetical protein
LEEAVVQLRGIGHLQPGVVRPIVREDLLRLVICNNGTFTIKRRPESVLQEAWQGSLKAAKDLQDGKEVGRIGYYAPDIVIKGNMIDSITGQGFLY